MTREDAQLLADLIAESTMGTSTFRTGVEKSPAIKVYGVAVAVEGLKSGFRVPKPDSAKPIAALPFSTVAQKLGPNSWKLVAITELIRRGAIGPPHCCWIWPGPRTRGEYGVVILDAYHRFFVHRLSFELHKGKIPVGLEVMHECDFPPCWNPKHLFLGTKSDNAQDAIQKGRR